MSPLDGDHGRPIPFTLQVAAVVRSVESVAREEDEILLYRERAELTGNVGLTDRGHDLQFSDIEVER